MAAIVDSCGYDYECFLTKLMTKSLCKAQGNDSEICDIITAVIGERYNRKAQLAGIPNEMMEWYEEHNSELKYQKKPKMLMTDLQNNIRRKRREYSKPTKNERKIQKHVRENKLVLNDMILQLAENEDIRDLAYKIKDMHGKTQPDGIMTTIKNMGLKISAIVRSTWGLCLDSPGTCIAIVATIIAIIGGTICYFSPGCNEYFTGMGDWLYEIQGTFMQAMFGWEFKITYTTYRVVKNEELELSKVPTYWQNFVNFSKKYFSGPRVGEQPGNMVKKRGEIVNALTLKKATSLIDIVMLASMGLEPILVDSTSLKSLIDMAYYASAAVSAVKFARDATDCTRGDGSKCLSVFIRAIGFCASAYIKRHFEDVDFDKSTILALQIEGKIISETFWFLVEQAAGHNLFPSIIGNNKYEQLKNVARMRSCVSLMNLICSARHVLPVMAEDYAKGMEKMGALSGLILDVKMTDFTQAARGRLWLYDVEEEKNKLEEAEDIIREALDAVDNEDKLINTSLKLLKAQQKALDIAHIELLKQRVQAFNTICKRFTIGYCTNSDAFYYGGKCLLFDNETIKNMPEKGKNVISLFVTEYLNLHGELLKQFMVAKDLVEIPTKIKDFGTEIDRVIKDLETWTTAGKDLILFNFVKEQIKTRAKYSNLEVESLVNIGTEIVKNDLIEEKIDELHDKLSLQVTDDLLKTAKAIPVVTAKPLSGPAYRFKF
jgi:hypothetical protein